MAWQATLGAHPEGNGSRFTVWAPKLDRLEVIHEPHGTAHPLAKSADGYFRGQIAGMQAGDRYRYRVDGQGPFPDPASRWQPEGVHGPSQIVDATTFAWTDAAWQGHAHRDIVLYELHLGTFTPEGTFAAAARRLPWLRELGVTAVELLPVADFPGERNWGYDGVSMFAPARCYGTPDELRAFVNRAHALGMSVFLDVVYNHFGPDGNYTGVYSPYYLSRVHKNPWGDSLNFDGPESRPVREFFLENALMWLADYHFDGLRLDATHAIMDEGPCPFLAELVETVHGVCPGWRRWIIAEDHRNFAEMLRPHDQGGWGLDGVWADDFHHEMRRLLAGDNEGYYRDFRGRTDDLATILNQGWLYCGQHSAHLDHPRGSDPAGLDPSQFVICLQNHDQIGNRAFGQRLHHQIDLAAYRAASAVLLLAPQMPLLFMGQEWATSSPFLFFTDHSPELAPLVTAGRRDEFRHFRAFSDPAVRETIPDPQSPATFAASRLDWSEIEHPDHAGVLALYRRLLHLRQTQGPLTDARAADEGTLVLDSRTDDGMTLVLVARLVGSGRYWMRLPAGEVLLHTEQEGYATPSRPPEIRWSGDELTIVFPGPAAVLVRGGTLSAAD